MLRANFAGIVIPLAFASAAAIVAAGDVVAETVVAAATVAAAAVSVRQPEATVAAAL